MKSTIYRSIALTGLSLLLVWSPNVLAKELPHAAAYTKALVQCSSLLKETVEQLKTQNSKKGRKKGGLESEESKTLGMQLLRKYGDTRLAIEEVIGKLEAMPEGEEGRKEMLDRCMGVWEIINQSRDLMLKAYEKPKDKKEVESYIQKLHLNMDALNAPRGKYRISD